MARTRNRQMKQAEAFVQASPQKIWKAGIYTRISVDINGEKRESLETQKLIALSYAESHPDIEVVKFYKDDGISGTKFDRDDFVRMLGDIKTKEINTVIVKDLSRFGRDLEEVSKYLEKIFPFMQVRFISVNDNYDSISPECDNEQYVSGEIDTDAYNRMTERITVVEKDLVTRQKEIEKSRKITEKLCKKNFSWLAEFSKGKNLEFLTKDVVRSYIKKISLYEDKRIEIEFKFQDEIQALSEILEEGVIRCQMVSA